MKATQSAEPNGLDRVRIRVLPDGRVTRADAARFLGCSPKTLAMWAMEAKGPPMVKVGGRAFYRIEEVQAFARGE